MKIIAKIKARKCIILHFGMRLRLNQLLLSVTELIYPDISQIYLGYV